MPALAMGDDARQHRLQAVDHSAEVDADAPVPVGVGGVQHRPLDADSGVVDQHMDVAEAGLRLVRCGGEPRPVGHVQADDMHRAALLDALEPGQGVVQVILPEVGDDHVHTRAHERLGDPQADAARPAGDERGLALEIVHGPPVELVRMNRLGWPRDRVHPARDGLTASASNDAMFRNKCDGPGRTRTATGRGS